MIGHRSDWGQRALGLVAAGTLIFILAPAALFAGKAAFYSWQIFRIADGTSLAKALALDGDILPAFANSLILAAIVGLLASLWGLGLATLWVRWAESGRWMGIALSALPLLLPRFLLAGALGLGLVELGGAFGLIAAGGAQIFMATPAAAAIIAIGRARLDSRHLQIAAQAGAGRHALFHQIVLPALRFHFAIAIASGFLLSFGDFYLGYILAADSPLLSPVLFSGLAAGQSPLYYPLALAAILIESLGAILIAYLWRRAQRPR